MRRCSELVCLLAIFCVVQANPIRQKRGYDDNFNVLLNIYKMNPLKQSNVFKSFSDRILLPRPSPDSNNNGKESAEEKKVNTNKEIKPTTNVVDNRKDDNKNSLSILKDKIRNESLIHDLNMKLDTMSAEIMNILELLGNNKTQSERAEIKNDNHSKDENVENKSNFKATMDDKHKSLAQNANVTQKNKNSHLQSEDKIFLIKNVMQHKIQDSNKTSLDSLNYSPGNRLKNQNFVQNGKIGENNMLQYGNKATNPASVPELRIYSEEYLRNTIFYDDDFDNDRAYKVQDNEITDKDRYVNAEVVIF